MPETVLPRFSGGLVKAGGLPAVKSIDYSPLNDMNPTLRRELFEMYFGMYGDEGRANQALLETALYMKKNPSAMNLFTQNVNPIADVLKGQMNEGLGGLKKNMLQEGQGKIRSTTQRNIKQIREAMDPLVAKTVGVSAYNEAYKTENEAMQGLENRVDLMDMEYRSQAISKLLGLEGMRIGALESDRNYEQGLTGQSESRRQFNAQMDAEGDFDWGGAIGGLLGGAAKWALGKF